jgi:hypothetical protein
MLLCCRQRKRVVDADGVHDRYNEGHQKKKKTLIEGLGWVFALHGDLCWMCLLLWIFARCAFYFGLRSTWETIDLFVEVEFETYLESLLFYFIFFLFLIQCY